MYPAAKSKVKVFYKEPLLFDEDYFCDYFYSRSTDRGQYLITMYQYHSSNVWLQMFTTAQIRNE